MLVENSINKLFVVQHVIDFRKGHQGLMGEVNRLGLKIYSGHIAVFISRCRTKIKIFSAEETGTCILYKQFYIVRMKTKFKFLLDTSTLEISMAELMLLLEGSSYKINAKTKKFLPSNGCGGYLM